jgi:biopolymer transport protein ExbD
MARRRSRQSGLRTVNDINVTPLMDLTFLLLIVFMITAPTLEYETDVSPPDMKTNEQVNPDDAVIINLAKDGTIWLHKETVKLAGLTARLSAERQQNPKIRVLIRGDEKRQYGEVIEIMKAVRKANIGSVSLVTETES